MVVVVEVVVVGGEFCEEKNMSPSGRFFLTVLHGGVCVAFHDTYNQPLCSLPSPPHQEDSKEEGVGTPGSGSGRKSLVDRKRELKRKLREERDRRSREMMPSLSHTSSSNSVTSTSCGSSLNMLSLTEGELDGSVSLVEEDSSGAAALRKKKREKLKQALADKKEKFKEDVTTALARIGSTESTPRRPIPQSDSEESEEGEDAEEDETLSVPLSAPAPAPAPPPLPIVRDRSLKRLADRVDHIKRYTQHLAETRPSS